MGIDLAYFDEAQREAIQNTWEAWWAGQLDRSLISLQSLPAQDLPYFNQTAPYFASNLPLDLGLEETVDRYQARLQATHYFGDALPTWYPNYGPVILAGFAGARIIPNPGADTAWVEAEPSQSLSEIHISFDPQNEWFRRVNDITRLAVERWGGKVAIGMTDLGEDLDLLAALRSNQKLMLDLCDEPDSVREQIAHASALWKQCYDHFYALVAPAGCGTDNWAYLWSPQRTYILQNDFSFMLSPRMFQQFVIPTLEERCAYLDHSFFHFHFDNPSQEEQLELLLRIQGLHGIQWANVHGWNNPGDYLPVLKRIRDAGKLCQPWGITPEAAQCIVKELGGRGFYFCFDEESHISPQDAPDLFRILSGYSTK